jgi:hypothetical protein
METNNKELYERPAITIVEVKQEGVICQSVNPTYNPMNPEQDWTF